MAYFSELPCSSPGSRPTPWPSVGLVGNIRTAYTYSPYGSVTATGNVTQPIQWSSEFNDEEMGLVYYNWRYFDSLSGKWIERDELWEKVSQNLYSFCNNFPCNKCDVLGLSTIWEKGGCVSSCK
ncbi:MAG: hypothetical protein IJB64_02355 [Akkermansia sp.]|nr:hypothetical protein [Akkermansia sp.]